MFEVTAFCDPGHAWFGDTIWPGRVANVCPLRTEYSRQPPFASGAGGAHILQSAGDAGDAGGQGAMLILRNKAALEKMVHP